MAATPTLEPLVAAGLYADLTEDGRFFVGPSQRITENLRSYIREHRAELIAELSAASVAARIDDATRACWLRIDDFWPLGLGVSDQKLVDLEECLNVAAGVVDYAVVLRVLAAYEARARELAEAAHVTSGHGGA
jgi:hypothetical protein